MEISVYSILCNLWILETSNLENIINRLQGLWWNNKKEKFFFSGNFSVEEYNKTQDKEADNTYSDLENNNGPLADVKVNIPYWIHVHEQMHIHTHIALTFEFSI